MAALHIDFAQYVHQGSSQASIDALRLRADDDLFAAVVCDGQGGVDAGESVAVFCAESIIETIVGQTESHSSKPRDPELLDSKVCSPGVPSPEASGSLCVLQAHQNVRARQAQMADPAWATARSTAAMIALNPQTGVLNWANVGDSRVYVFCGGTLLEISPDDSAAYVAWQRGEIDREGIRLSAARTPLTACLGDEHEPLPHSGTTVLGPGDAVLVCSDGFWEYVFDLEMLVDLSKSQSAEQWLRLMLLRLTQRSYLTGDSLSALACRILA